jgi:hypothetical protein
MVVDFPKELGQFHFMSLISAGLVFDERGKK